MLVLAALLQSLTYPPTTGDFSPDWLRRPSLEEVGRVYPAAAGRKRLNGEAELDCTANGGGRLASCRVASETPGGYGFGAAALQLRSIYVMRPLLPDGRSVGGGHVRIRVSFRYAELRRLGLVRP